MNSDTVCMSVKCSIFVSRAGKGLGYQMKEYSDTY